MFSDPGFSALGLQLELYRWEDHARRMRDIRARNSSLNVAHAQLDWLADQHENLATQYNKLVDGCSDAAKDWERRERDVERQLDERDARIQELERELAAAKATEYNLRLAAHERLIANIDRWQALDRKDVAGSQAG